MRTARSRTASSAGAHARPATGCGPLWGTDLVAVLWVPEAALCRPEFVWAALDCPGAYACGALGRGAVVLGRLTARVGRLPRPGERCVVLGWPIGAEGRRLFAGTTLLGEAGDVIGIAKAIWVVPRFAGA